MKKKEKKSFSRVCRNIHAAAVLFMAFEVLEIALIILGAAGVPLPYIELEYSGHFVELVPELVWDVTLLLVCSFARQVFGRLRKSDTPFLECVPRKFKAIAYALVIGGGTHFFSSLIIYGYLSFNLSVPDAYFSSDGVFMVMIGAVIWGLAYIFERGFELQQESDETI